MTIKLKHWLFIIITFSLLFMNKIYKEGIDMFNKVINLINYYYFIPVVLSIIAFLLIDGLVLNIIRKVFTKNSCYKSSLYCSLACIFFGSISPLQIANIPTGIYCLTKDNISSGTSTSILVVKNIIIMFSSLIFYSLLVLTNISYFNLNSTLLIAIYLGLASLFVFLILLVLASIAYNLLLKVSSAIILLLSKIRVIKDKEIAKEKARIEIFKLRDNLLNIKNLFSKKKILLLIILSIIEIASFQQILYFIYLSFGFTNDSYINLLSGQAFCSLIMSVIPIPGGMGVVDAAFTSIMKQLFTSSYISYALFLWRLFSYYLLIFISLFGLAVLKNYKK